MNMAHMHAWRWDRTLDVFEFAIVEGQEAHLPTVFPGMHKLMARVHPGDRSAVRRAIDDAFQNHVEVQEEFRLKGVDSRYRWYAAIARPLFDAGTVPRGLVGVIQDVTARRDSEVRLRRSEELLRATTANTADTLILVDTDLRVRFINKNVGGLAIDQIIGREVGVLLPETARARVLWKLRDILDTGETATYEFECVEDDHVGPRPQVAAEDAEDVGQLRARRRVGRVAVAAVLGEGVFTDAESRPGIGRVDPPLNVRNHGAARRVPER